MNNNYEKSDTFANRLYTAMNMKNINQVQLAEKTKSIKYISQSLINKYLKGKALARQDNIYILAKILDVNEAWLMGFDVNVNRTPDEKRNDIFQKVITDNSMAPLLDIDDVAYIMPQDTYNSGDTIYFKLNSENYIRKIIDYNEYIEFHAMNPYYPIQKYTRNELTKNGFIIIGRVIKAENKSAFK